MVFLYLFASLCKLTHIHIGAWPDACACIRAHAYVYTYMHSYTLAQASGPVYARLYGIMYV